MRKGVFGCRKRARTLEARLALLGGNDSQRPVIEAQVSETKRRVEMWSHDESDRRVAELPPTAI
jgi:hypothetical protein